MSLPSEPVPPSASSSVPVHLATPFSPSSPDFSILSLPHHNAHLQLVLESGHLPRLLHLTSHTPPPALAQLQSYRYQLLQRFLEHAAFYNADGDYRVKMMEVVRKRCGLERDLTLITEYLRQAAAEAAAKPVAAPAAAPATGNHNRDSHPSSVSSSSSPFSRSSFSSLLSQLSSFYSIHPPPSVSVSTNYPEPHFFYLVAARIGGRFFSINSLIETTGTERGTGRGGRGVEFVMGRKVRVEKEELRVYSSVEDALRDEDNDLIPLHRSKARSHSAQPNSLHSRSPPTSHRPSSPSSSSTSVPDSVYSLLDAPRVLLRIQVGSGEGVGEGEIEAGRDGIVVRKGRMYVKELVPVEMVLSVVGRGNKHRSFDHNRSRQHSSSTLNSTSSSSFSPSYSQHWHRETASSSSSSSSSLPLPSHHVSPQQERDQLLQSRRRPAFR